MLGNKKYSKYCLYFDCTENKVELNGSFANSHLAQIANLVGKFTFTFHKEILSTENNRLRVRNLAKLIAPILWTKRFQIKYPHDGKS
jgi:hypothetical protein